MDGLVDFYEQHVPVKARVSGVNTASGRSTVSIATTTCAFNTKNDDNEIVILLKV